MMRIAGQILGGIAILIGLLWMGQGSGYFPYPAASFMIDQSIWIYWGLLALVLGLAVFVIARRLPR